jgi:hypothetical protein
LRWLASIRELSSAGVLSGVCTHRLTRFFAEKEPRTSMKPVVKRRPQKRVCFRIFVRFAPK